VPLLAPECRYCGAPNPVRRTAIIGIAAIVLVAGAIAAAVLVAVMPGADPGSGSATDQSVPTGGGNFVWLENAMKECDEHAAREPKSLVFLVTPLVDEPRDELGWRRISINDIGNAILINAQDALAGLRRKALQIATAEYVFSIRNDGTKVVFAWKPSVGVRKFVNTDAAAIENFRVQFQSSDPARSVNWGSAIPRQAGNCYWVNAILRQ
jgi:hypothetical protein